MVQDYRNEILGAIDSMMLYDKDMLTNEIPPEFNKALQDNNSPSRVARMMMGLAFGGIDEFEDDFDSDDSELLSQMWQKKVSTGDSSFTGLSGFGSAASRVGLST